MKERDARNGRRVIANGFFGIAAPMVGSSNPKTMFKFFGLSTVVHKGATGSSQKTVHSRFVDDGILLIAFALDCPISSVRGFCDQIDTGIVATQIAFERKFVPKPNFCEQIGIIGFGEQIKLHQAFETFAFVFLRKRFFAELIENGLKGGHNIKFLERQSY
jgi:hypothetical protein